MDKPVLLNVINDIKNKYENKKINSKKEFFLKDKINHKNIQSPKKVLRKNISTDNFMKFQWPWIL